MEVVWNSVAINLYDNTSTQNNSEQIKDKALESILDVKRFNNVWWQAYTVMSQTAVTLDITVKTNPKYVAAMHIRSREFGPKSPVRRQTDKRICSILLLLQSKTTIFWTFTQKEESPFSLV